jgi:hypothetical protein
MWLFLMASMPRGLMTATESTSLSLPVSSLMIKFLTVLLMIYLLFVVCCLLFVVTTHNKQPTTNTYCTTFSGTAGVMVALRTTFLK